MSNAYYPSLRVDYGGCGELDQGLHQIRFKNVCRQCSEMQANRDTIGTMAVVKRAVLERREDSVLFFFSFFFDFTCTTRALHFRCPIHPYGRKGIAYPGQKKSSSSLSSSSSAEKAQASSLDGNRPATQVIILVLRRALRTHSWCGTARCLGRSFSPSRPISPAILRHDDKFKIPLPKLTKYLSALFQPSISRETNPVSQTRSLLEWQLAGSHNPFVRGWMTPATAYKIFGESPHSRNPFRSNITPIPPC